MVFTQILNQRGLNSTKSVDFDQGSRHQDNANLVQQPMYTETVCLR